MFQLGVRRHRLDAHPEVPIATWKSRNITANVVQGTKRRLANQRRRVTILTKGPPKVAQGEYEVFRWPQIHPRRWLTYKARKFLLSEPLTLRLSHAFRCKRCGGSYATASAASNHSCTRDTATVQARIQRQIQRLDVEEKRSRKLPHGFSAADHQKLFALARDVIAGAASSTS